MQLAALAHDIDWADEKTKVKRADFDDYDAFKAAHARHGAVILKEILVNCQVEPTIIEQACELVIQHEVGGNVLSDLLKDADSLSYFEVNMPPYYAREGYAEILRRCKWGYQRLSPKMKPYLKNMSYQKQVLNEIVQETLSSCEQKYI